MTRSFLLLFGCNFIFNDMATLSEKSKLATLSWVSENMATLSGKSRLALLEI